MERANGSGERIRFPGFRSHRLLVAREGGEELEMAYFDNHLETDAPALLLLHGIFDSKATWRDLCGQLGNRFRMVAPDLIGFGYSSKPRLSGRPAAYRYSSEMLADCLERFILALGLDDLVLVGNSLGGGIALRLYLTRLHLHVRLRGLVLVNAAGYPQELPGYIRDMAGWAGALMQNPFLRALFFRLGLVRRMVRASFRRSFYDPEKIPGDLVEESMSVLRTPGIFPAYRLAARNIVPPDHEALVSRFGEIACPVLILWGREDRIVPSLFALRFGEDIPHADLRIFERCGHAPHIEYPGETASSIAAWMAKHFSGSEVPP